MNEKRCFVVMGFGIKTDLATGRKLNLDKSYLSLIKPAVEDRGITCLRADEIKNSGAIELPMYQQLLTADLVIADLSTANVNAFYELGIRHALRPRTTIIMSEEQMSYPFDVNHIKINKYTHLGDSIDYLEALRFQKLLKETIDNVLNDDQPDSPVYTFLDGLVPPELRDRAENVAKKVGDALSQAPQQDTPDNQTLSIIVKQAEEALKNKQYAVAKGFFDAALLIAGSNTEQHIAANNSYLIHRLAYTTYKAELPNAVAAAEEALRLLGKLDLQHTNDAETVSLAGRIEKRLYCSGEGEQHLSNAILYFERACYLWNNRYNNINLAFLLNLRVDTSIFTSRPDKIADMVVANRIRRQVLQLCDEDMKNLDKRKQQATAQPVDGNTSQLAISQLVEDKEQQFWIWVNKAEAHFCLGQMEEYNQAREEAAKVPHDDEMMKSFDEEITRLKEVLDKYGALLNE